MKNKKWVGRHPVLTGVISFWVLMIIFGILSNDSSDDFGNEIDLLGENLITGEAISPINDNLPEISEPHWSSLPIKYFIRNEKECGKYESNRIIRAFNEISNSTNKTLYFEKINNSEEADIELFCSFIEDCYEFKVDREGNWRTETETICAYDKGVAQITDFEGSRIIKAEIELIGLAGFSETKLKGMSGFYVGTCGGINTEIHEILHVLGFGHSTNENNIMYPYQMETQAYKIKDDSCKNIDIGLDKEYSSCLKYIYSYGERGTCLGVEELGIGEEWDVSETASCQEGYYEATNEPDSCCPDSDMWVDGDYCYYSWESP